VIREVSAGGVVVRRFRGRPFVAVIATKGGAAIGLPKGHVDPGEEPAATAAREVREETGLDATLVGELERIEYWYVRRTGERVKKTVHFFLFRYRSGSVRDHDHEVDWAAWIPLEEAGRRLTYRGERQVAAAAMAALAPAR
jgi:8-oxo-dGTP pyrophosphatase MutT (NUDIX family)